MNEKLMAENNKILEIISGSFLYGTATETSDRDYMGVFIPDIEYIIGFKKCEEVDFSVISKNETGKNTKEALDRKLYSLQKFIKLALDNNPNVLEIIFVNKENTVFVNDLGKELLSMAPMFPYRGCKEKFLGYAFSQKHKMMIKKDHYFDLISGFDYLSRFNDDKYIVEVTMEKRPPFIQINNDEKHNCKFVVIGDLNITPSKTIKVAKKMIQERLDKVGNREELLLKYGFDTKFASHLIRLMVEGVKLLKDGYLEFPLKEAPMILDIKLGGWAISKILEYSNELEKEIESLAANSKLPSSPNTEVLERFTINKLKDYIIGKE